jgi:hypothetical protein
MWKSSATFGRLGCTDWVLPECNSWVPECRAQHSGSAGSSRPKEPSSSSRKQSAVLAVAAAQPSRPVSPAAHLLHQPQLCRRFHALGQGLSQRLCGGSLQHRRRALDQRQQQLDEPAGAAMGLVGLAGGPGTRAGPIGVPTPSTARNTQHTLRARPKASPMSIHQTRPAHLSLATSPMSIQLM